MKYIKQNSGYTLLLVISFGAIAIIFVVSLVSWTVTQSQLVRQRVYKELSIHIAEAGIDYYKWHLIQDPNDFQDGIGGSGPYIHQFFDANNNLIGEFELSIVPPVEGSTIATITSVGRTTEFPNIERAIQAVFAIPSFAEYAAVINGDVRFGEGTEIFGPVHSNGGIRFDALAHNLVSSFLNQYNDPDHGGSNEYAVHTHLSPQDPYPPTELSSRPDVFVVGRELDADQVNFGQLTIAIDDMEIKAQEPDGFYRGDSGDGGYHIVLKTDDTFDLYEVDSLVSAPPRCSPYQSGWGTWSISTEHLLGTYPFPANNIMFFADDIWVDGQIQSARLSIVASNNIIVNDDLIYTTHDGQEVLALIAQNNFNIGLKSQDFLDIDAALVAKNGRVGRHYYSSYCGTEYIRDTISLFGTIISELRYGFAYTDGTGYDIRNIESATADNNIPTYLRMLVCCGKKYKYVIC